jgi:single-stranded-DNA-specific exonuclease
LPLPTKSEAAFEALLAHFGEADDKLPAPVAQPALIAVEPDATAFLDALFAKASEYVERDRFGSIGEADDFFTKIVGVSFERRQDLIAGLSVGAPLELVREPENPHDPNAIQVRYGPLQLGFIRREIARHLAPNIEAGDLYAAEVASITGGGDKNVGVNIHVRRARPKNRAREAPGGDAEPRGESVGSDEIRRALIGERHIREAQRAVLDRLAAGRNVLAVMGTGRGKSLCFQLPAAERALASGEKTLVFYPLRALANDQFDALLRRLAPLGVRVLRANGAIDGDERIALEEALADGAWDIILATPEFAAYHRDAFARPVNRPSLLVVDEAHHLFESRHRVAYVDFAALLNDLGRPQVLALTATANDEAFRHMRSVLAIDAWIIDPTVRENLHVVDARSTKNKVAYLERALEGNGKAIVYCNSRAEANKVAEKLRRRFGPVVAFYHAGVPSAERGAIEDLFRRGSLRIVVATSAFGEGIDLPDVRDVVLYHLNFAFTAFNQQAGRAGRDDASARIHLLYGDADRHINDFILSRSAPSIAVLRELYRGMHGLASFDVVRMSYEDVARTLGLDRVDGSTVSAAVRIWEEAGLVETGRDDDGRFVRFFEVLGKVDLTQTTRYAEGEAERESFDRFCALALGADAESLEQIVNRPIYPDRISLRN